MDKYDAAVHQVLTDLMEEERSETNELNKDDRLVEDLGFSSLNMARIIAILEDQFGTDPFSKSVAITSIRTVGDLAGAYRQTLEAEARDPVRVTPLTQSQQRAAARRAALGDSTRRDVG